MRSKGNVLTLILFLTGIPAVADAQMLSAARFGIGSVSTPNPPDRRRLDSSLAVQSYQKNHAATGAIVGGAVGVLALVMKESMSGETPRENGQLIFEIGFAMALAGVGALIGSLIKD